MKPLCVVRLDTARGVALLLGTLIIGCAVTLVSPGGSRAEAAPAVGTSPASSGPAASNPLQPITELAQRMEKAMNAMLRGTDPMTAFSPVLVDSRLRVLQGTLRKAQVRSVRLLFQELEITFHPISSADPASGASVPVTMVKLGVAPWPTPALGQVRHSTLPDSQTYHPERSPSRYLGAGAGPGAPLGRVLQSVLREVRAGRCERLGLVQPAAWSSLLPSRGEQGDLNKDVAQARRGLAPACRRMRALLGHRINLFPDDMIFGALSSTGRLLGMIRCDPDWQGSPPQLRLRSCVYFPKTRRPAHE